MDDLDSGSKRKEWNFNSGMKAYSDDDDFKKISRLHDGEVIAGEVIAKVIEYHMIHKWTTTDDDLLAWLVNVMISKNAVELRNTFKFKNHFTIKELRMVVQ
ncbi:hypothetical protein F2Q70_00009322 [Brassica cretica]|uniref:Uncharacterized protein n=1 Tax=Brassica cretica TaxID=69181 RepID=A0A8S9LZJ1_BRACR|nr:hypothetical protein F2Q70_00009322 [Brassica cretica]KAF3550622.1 hypothetical protein DY000_02003216 [Brassica cretica]